jgi:O-antigen/teichoic acid export membrane protein
MATALFAIAWVASPFIATEILARPEMTAYLRIGFVGIFGIQFSGFWQSYFGARLEFVRNAAFSTVAPAAILAVVLLLWGRGTLDVGSCLHAYVWAPLLACSVVTAAVAPRFLGAAGPVLPRIREVWRFSRWVYASNALSIVRFRLNSILLARLATLPEVGLYGYADKLASVLTLFTSAVTTVFVPRASHLLDREELRALLRKSYRWLLILVPFLVAAPFAVRPAIAFLSPEYVEAAPICSILLVSILFSLASLPSNTVLYSLNKPHVETFVEVVALVLTGVLGYTLVRSHGGLGAAVAMLIQRFVSAVLVVGWVYVTVFRGDGARGAVER